MDRQDCPKVHENRYLRPLRNVLVCRLMLQLPIVNQVVVEMLLKEDKRITRHEVSSLIGKMACLSGATPRRRAQTIFAWFRWMQRAVGIIRVVGNEICMAPGWQGDN